jgi:hypothetical protein
MAKSDGNIQGVLHLIETYPLEKIKNIMVYWNELTIPYEERQKKAKRKIDDAFAETMAQNKGVFTTPDGKTIKLRGIINNGNGKSVS